MSVGLIQPIVPRMWRGYDDPGLPVGAWICYAVTLGDATGGNNVIDVMFKREDEPVSGRFYNLEQVNVFTAGILVPAVEVVVLSVNGFERLGSYSIGQRVLGFTIDNTGHLTGASLQFGLKPMPYFLGQAGSTASVESVIQFITNNTENIAFSVTAQGYIWDSRSVQAPGGLRRPLDSLYGA